MTHIGNESTLHPAGFFGLYSFLFQIIPGFQQGLFLLQQFVFQPTRPLVIPEENIRKIQQDKGHDSKEKEQLLFLFHTFAVQLHFVFLLLSLVQFVQSAKLVDLPKESLLIPL